MKGTSGFQEVQSATFRQHPLASCTSNSVDSGTVADTISPLIRSESHAPTPCTAASV